VNKGLSTKRKTERIFAADAQWQVFHGRLVPAPGRPNKVQHLFKVVAEKLPFTALDSVRKHMQQEGFSTDGIYVAHDSMGYARYVGRGSIFARLKARKKAQILELFYFSFYVVLDKKHEREIETLLIRAAGPLLAFNTRKKQVTILPGNIRDYEPGTHFYERHYKRGTKSK
jgi:hypothetical protein